MLTKTEYKKAQTKALGYLEQAGIIITGQEKRRIEVLDFGYGELEKMGLEILVYINTQKVCAKELVLFPRQTCAEHIHPQKNGMPGKEETFRCRWGKVYLYVCGEKTQNPGAIRPKGYEEYLTCDHEIELNPGEQYTLEPNTWHWFQAGDSGAIVSEFSTTNTDEFDEFTDIRISRFTRISDGNKKIENISYGEIQE
jgi:D-lyxose ketol-isomerase